MNKTEKLICLVLGGVLAWYLFVQSPRDAAARAAAAQPPASAEAEAPSPAPAKAAARSTCTSSGRCPSAAGCCP